MPIPDLTDEEQAAVTAALLKLIADDKFPCSQRLKAAQIGIGEARPEAGKATANRWRV
jgi:hypothetical protein